jgi:hypothetical protein
LVGLKRVLGVKLLTIDEVTAIWGCHRITVLRLMERGVLDWIEVPEGDFFFEQEDVLRLKNSRIRIFPHLTVSKGKSSPPKPSQPPKPPKSPKPPRRRR